jgi:HD-like signal output (HDOD) protein
MFSNLESPPDLAEVCDRALKLPGSPAILPQLMAALHQTEGTAGEIGRIVCLDSALAAATLRLANSAGFGAREPVDSIEQALVMLGHREIYRLAAQSVVSRWEKLHYARLPWEPGELFRHSLCTALAAEVIAEAGGGCEPQVAYTAGLVCDLGKLALAYVCAEHYPQVSGWAARTGCLWSDAETAVLGYHQTEVSARLLRAWGFAENLARAVEMQLHPADAPAEIAPLAAHLHAARYLAVTLGPGVTEGGFLFNLDGGLLTAQGFSRDFLEKALIEVRERALRRMAERLTHGLF